MQFYLNGYKPGDPAMPEPHGCVVERSRGLPEEVDVLIVGCGPAGLVLAAQMAIFPEIRTLAIDRREGPLAIGQADGVACRTVEIFETFGLADRLVAEGYWVNEVCFWQPDPDDRSRVRRTGRVRDTEEGVSEFPHVTVNQARMLAYLLEYMERSSSRLAPSYGAEASGIKIDTSGACEYPVTVIVKHVGQRQETSATSTIRAKYVVGCDGARSVIRTAIGQELLGDAMDVSWGVMDVLAVTDFPDVRLKSTIHSSNGGNMLIIPREGGYLIRLYIELDTADDREMVAAGTITPEKLAAIASRIMHPYRLDVKDVGWWSVYDIGQRLCMKFDDVPVEEMDSRTPRVFIAGDACHTHSAKAGQGMNVSIADAWNLGWKLAAVVRGTARPELLHSYSDERQKVAQELIDFDQKFARLFSARPHEAGDADGYGIDPDEFRQYFIQQGRFTAGVATKYATSVITGGPRFQDLAKGYPIGMRFHSAPVLRFADAKPIHLGHVARADGAWRLYVFADALDPANPSSQARALCEFLGSDNSPLARFTLAEGEPDSLIDVRAIFQQLHRDLTLEHMPSILLPKKGRLGLTDYEKIFCSDPAAGDIFDLRGVDRERGCMVLVRPDQYVADVLPLEEHEALTSFLEGTLIEPAGQPTSTPVPPR